MILLNEAHTVFYDEFAIQFFDEDTSEAEDRFLMPGLSSFAQLLMVCHCERRRGNTIRIISARKATKSEITYYLGARS